MNAVAESTAEANVSGVERAAQLLLLLGEDSASRIMQELNERAIEKLGRVLNGMSALDDGHAQSAAEDFLEQYQTGSGHTPAGTEFARRVLNPVLGDERTEEYLREYNRGSNTQAIEALHDMKPDLVAAIIGDEHPQIQAIILSYLPPEHAGAVLLHMPESRRYEVMVRMASTEAVDPSALDELNDSLQLQLEGIVAKQKANSEGTRMVANIVNTLSPESGDEVIQGLLQVNESLAMEVREQMYVFSDLLSITDRDFQAVMREAPTDRLTLALKGAEDELKEKVFSNMSSRAAEILKEDLEEMGPVKVTDVEEAQKEILEIVKSLMESGVIAERATASDLVA